MKTAFALVTALLLSTPSFDVQASQAGPYCTAPGKCVVFRNFWGDGYENYYSTHYQATVYGFYLSQATYCKAISRVFKDGALITETTTDCLERLRNYNPMYNFATNPNLFRIWCGKPATLTTKMYIHFASGERFESPVMSARKSPCESI